VNSSDADRDAFLTYYLARDKIIPSLARDNYFAIEDIWDASLDQTDDVQMIIS